ncbi:tetrahydromethanopterin S-methyltransferase subunit A [Methanosphaera cuniculi]|uniref:tetrahydromethanopterin S-methyltransferase subunit A n=1 Tax=Methanosphaera cuniculi TaxID=1077256 RepID=UPI0026EA4392|nr:tetrahydromethanopterin S-methyltransferase subunit A [Methanosphaera cuniculi]
MANKKEVIKDWPLETGDYLVGDPTSSVAIVSLGSKMNEELIKTGVAIAGPLHTENLGIEKVVANIISNPNIRYLVICGSEVQGHITGQTVEALYENGIDEETKSIIGSDGAIPFVENLEVDAIERFQDQIELVSMIDNENLDEIQQAVDKCLNEDKDAYNEDALIINLNEKPQEDDDEESETTLDETTNMQTSPVSGLAVNFHEIEVRIRFLNARINELAKLRKISSGYYAGKIEGIVIGFILTIIVFLILQITGI